MEELALLERSIGYTLGAVAGMRTGHLSRATPCAGWDLRTLMEHVTDSLTVLHQAATSGTVDPDPPGPGTACHAEGAASLAAAFRHRAHLLLEASTASEDGDRIVAVLGWPMPLSWVAGAGAVEIAVHGWDVSWACGVPRAMPTDLARELLRTSQLLVTDATRSPMFAPAVPVPRHAGPTERLLAFLGRRP